jgi:uncharacterized protein (DUF302 family)
MSYYFSTTIDASFEDAVKRATAALSTKGFGVLTTIDVRATMKNKLGVDFRPYLILGACNPHFAWRALQSEDKIATMLPCNVILSEVAPGRIEVAAVDPVASMAAIQNPALAEIAGSVREALRQVIEGVADRAKES